MTSVFIDFLTIRQDHVHGGLPVLNNGHVLRIDSEGVLECSTDMRFSLVGSYDSSVQVRCDGFSVEFTGNISRFCRRDNLFGYDWNTTIQKVNALIESLGLPPFTTGRFFDVGVNGLEYSGARVSRVDITCNYSTGSKDNLSVVLAHMAGQHVGRQKGSLSMDAGTVEYGRGSKYVYGKLYAKYMELEHHRRKKSGSHVSKEVIDYCINEGILREEFTLKSRFLLQNGLAFLGAISQSKLNEIYNERSQLIRLEKMTYDNINDLPQRLRSSYASWKLGLPVAVSKATFYRHRNELLAYGVDISVPNNVHYLPERVRVVTLQALTAPAWYLQNYG